MLYHQQLIATDMHWINGTPSQSVVNCQAKIRYRQADQDCRVDINENGDVNVYFNEPQRAVTPGQSLVLYQGERCLGGGIIASRYQ